MNLLEFLVMKVCEDYAQYIFAENYYMPSDDKQYLRALTVLQLVTEYTQSFTNCQRIVTGLKRINQRLKEVLGKAIRVSEFTADHFPMYVATQMLLHNKHKIMEYPFRRYVNHHRSDIRLQSYYVIWLIRKCVQSPGVIGLLLENVSKSLAYNEAAIGLVQYISKANPNLLEFVKNYKPNEGLTDEFKKALTQFDRQDSYMANIGGFLSMELRLRDWLYNKFSILQLEASDS